MAVAYVTDAQATTTVQNSTDVSAAITISGSDTVIVAGVAVRAGSLTSVKFDGIDMTQQSSETRTMNGVSYTNYIYTYLNGTGSGTSKNITVAKTSSEAQINAMAFSGVGSFGTAVDGQGNTSPASITVTGVGANDMMWFNLGLDNGFTTTAGTGQTKATNNSTAGNYEQMEHWYESNENTMSASWSGSANYIASGIPIIAGTQSSTIRGLSSLGAGK